MDDVFIGIEIGGTKLQLVAGTAAGEIRDQYRYQVNRDEGGAGIRQQIERAMPDILEKSKAKGLAVGFGGPVDWRTGQICCSHQIGGWSEFDLRQWLEGVAGLAVKVDNDANMAALGEAHCGGGAGFNPVFYVTLGSGVGGGLVVNGTVYHGAKPGEAEIGHIRLDKQGTIVEARCSGWAVDAKIRKLKASGSDSILCKLSAQESQGEAKHLLAALQQNDSAGAAILRETAEDLAFGLSHVTHLFHPEVIVLGGGLSLVGEPLRKAVADVLPSFVMAAFGSGPQVRLAALGEKAVPTGCLLAAGRA